MRLAVLYALSLFAALVLQFVQVPDWLAVVWPAWTTLLLAAWAVHAERLPHLPVAVVLGVILDVGFAAPLGEHALALLVVIFLAMRMRPTLETVSWWHGALLMLPVWLLGAAILAVIDHVAHHEAVAALRWLPTLSGAVLWPVFSSWVGEWVHRSTRPVVE
ncbi:MAG TPA: rod shape-determining protein MreD [Nevskiaceae bacterium]|nr:rod shape-determining protein MreD [Nevskiaceae bacterium]